MIDVIYCPQCKQFRKVEEQYNDDELYMYIENHNLECPTCPISAHTYLCHIDSDGIPRLYEVVCGEDLPMYDTYLMVSESATNLKDKENILRKALVLSKKWAKEETKRKSDEEKRRKDEEAIKRAERLIELLQRKHNLENRIKPLLERKEYLQGQYSILSHTSLSDPILGKSRYARMGREFFVASFNQVDSDLDKIISVEQELANIAEELKSVEGRT